MSKGKKIVELFTNLRTHIEDKDGQIDMHVGAIRPDPANKAACIGCWLADYFKTKVELGHRQFNEGIKALEKYLGIDELKHFLEDNSEHWHNDYALWAFHKDGEAYGDTNQYPSITDVTDAWISFGEKLQTIED